MSNTNYNETVRDHFLHPRNQGKIENPDGIGTVGNPRCGDVMQITIKVGNDIIKDIKFETFGCAAAISSSSMLTELAKNKTLDEAKNITNQEVANSLGGLPIVKMHCSNLAADALAKAIDNYKSK